MIKKLVKQAKSDYNASYYEKNKKHIMQMRKKRYKEDAEYRRLIYSTALATIRLESLCRKKSIAGGLRGKDIAYMFSISPSRIYKLEKEGILFNIFSTYTLSQAKLIGFVLQRLKNKPKIKAIINKYKHSPWGSIRKEVSKDVQAAKGEEKQKD